METPAPDDTLEEGAAVDETPPDETVAPDVAAELPATDVPAEPAPSIEGLTPQAAQAAHDLTDAARRLAGHALDAGESAIRPALAVVIEANTEIGKLLATLSQHVGG